MTEKALIERVFKKIDDRRDEMVEFLQNLVRIPSIPGSREEGEAQHLVQEELEKIDGIKIDVWEPVLEEIEKYPLHPIRLIPWSYSGRPNVVGLIRGVDHGHSLILNGHIDVVSPEPLEAWRYPPWDGLIRDGRLFGRGSADMKAGLAAMIYAAKCIQDLKIDLKGDLILESVVEEEYGGGGTIAALLRGYRGDAAIVIEPTGSSNLCIGSCGSRFFKLRLLGRSEIPTRAHLAVNAIELSYKMYNALRELGEKRFQRLKNRHPLFEADIKKGIMAAGGRPTNLTIGILRAGDWPATVAGWAEFECRIGFPPSERGSEVEREFEEVVRKVGESDPWMKDHPPKIRWFGARREAYELSPDETIVKTVSDSMKTIVGEYNHFATPAAADTAYFTPRVNGFGGIPAVMYGPGGDSAHAADEYVELEEVVRVTKVLALSILDWCDHITVSPSG